MRNSATTIILMMAVVVYVGVFLIWRGRHDRRVEKEREEEREKEREQKKDDDAGLSANELEEAKKNNLEQVKLLFDYTKFHLTGYTTIAALLTAIVASPHLRVTLFADPLPAAVLAIVAAGWAAGVVAASMPECTNRLEFWEWRTGPYDREMMTIRSWTYLEHTSFWLAVLLVLTAFLAPGQ